MDAKSTHRKAAKNQRNGLSPRVRQFAALEVSAIGCKLLAERKGLIIAGYMPIGSELDPRILMQDLERRGHQLALPVVTGVAKPLTFKRYGFGDPLEQNNTYGIEEPLADAPESTPDVILVPGLAFDASLYRLGYGGGFYDRTLTNMIKSGRRMDVIGIAFASQMVETLPREDHDIPMSMVLTEAGISVPVL